MTQRITIDREDPRYWNYDDERLLLLGATDTDSLFQWTGNGLEEHLDDLVSVGGNYVRNTMSDRQRDYDADDKKSGSVYAFESERPGRFDLERWNEGYWQRLRDFLEETASRDVFVELTLWDQHDFSDGLWEKSPWNPENNTTYSSAESGIDGRSDFFAAVERDNDLVTAHQERFVRKILSISLEYGHVLYNITNEGWAGLPWENHWCDIIHEEARAHDVEVHVANMNMSPRISFDKSIIDPERYSFVEISQHNQDTMGKFGQEHWDDLMTWRLALHETGGLRPMNNVKIYGSEKPHVHAGDAEEAVDRMWRAILAGCASERFHRPIGAGAGEWGIGLNDRARSTIRSIRLLADEVDLTETIPRNDLLVNRTPNDSYCVTTPNEQYVVYLPKGGSAILDLYRLSDDRHSKWLNVETGDWEAGDGGTQTEVKRTGGGEPVELEAPGDGSWIVVFSN